MDNPGSLLVTILPAILGVVVAGKKNRNQVKAALLCFFLSWIGFVIVLLLEPRGKVKTQDSQESSILPTLPSMVKNAFSKMSGEKQEMFLEEYYRRARSVSTAYVVWFLFGFHYIYVKKWGTQLLFWITGGGFLIWWIIDLFRVSSLVKEYNKTIAIEVMTNLKTITS